MSNISLKGNLGRVKPLTSGPDGTPRLSFSVAEDHSRKNQDGSWSETGTTWLNVTVFGAEAKNLAEVLQEGAKQRLAVSGRMSTREYTTDSGQQGSSLDVVADVVGILPPKAGGQSQGGGQRAAAPEEDPWSNSGPSNGDQGPSF